MNQEQKLIVETARRIFADQCSKQIVDEAEAGKFPLKLWQTLNESGLVHAAVPEAQGGAGGTLGDALRVVREAGFAAAPIPLADTTVAGLLLAAAGLPVPDGLVVLARVTGQGTLAVSFAQQADHILIVHESNLELVNADSFTLVDSANNLAGEPYAWLTDCQVIGQDRAGMVPLPNALQTALELGAAGRVNLMAGAMNSVLQMSVDYALERKQFGRPIAGFQAIQHQLAILAGEVAACTRAADSLLNDYSRINVAIAKARVGEAVAAVTDIAHQVHGAMGYSLEHPLNHRTRRLWVWRDEFGNERSWQAELGQQLCQNGPDQLWDAVTSAA